ncbi:MFS transporter [Chloroflexota bacterium]
MSESGQVNKNSGHQSYRSLFIIALRYRDFRLVWLGSVTEHIGEFMQIAAVLWLVNEISHSPLMLTVVGSCRIIPLIFLPPVAGVVTDRVNRRNLLIVVLFCASLLSVCLALLVITGVVVMWHIIVLSLLMGVLTSFNHPARQAIVPNLIRREHLLNAVSLDTLSVQVARLVGMSVVGYLIAGIGVGPIFFLRALGCLLAIVWLLFARIPPTPAATRKQKPWRNLIEGFHYLRGNTLILGLVLLYLIPMLAQNTYTNFMPVFAADIMQVGAIGYGYFQAAPGLGSLLCLIALTVLTYYKGKINLLLGASAIVGISLIGLSITRSAFLTLPLLVVIGGMITVFLSINTTLIQNSIPDEMRGRVMSWREVARGVGPTASILFGAIAQYTGVPFSLGLLGGIVLLVSFALIMLSPKFRSLG